MAGLAAALVAVSGPGAPAERPQPASAPAPRKPFGLEEVDAAVTRGLDFLENAQQPGGFWQNPDRKERVENTGWALLAFLANGHTPRSGPYRQTVEKGLAWFVDAVRDYPDKLDPRTIGPGYVRLPGYKDEAFCFFVVLTAAGTGAGQVADEDLILYCERAVKVALDVQFKKEESAGGFSLRQHFSAGGWKGIEESYWFTLCLLAGRQLGIKVPPIALENVREFWVRHYQPQFGTFYDELDYNWRDPGRDTGPTFGARVLTVLALLGQDKGSKLVHDALGVLGKCNVGDPVWYWNFGGNWYHHPAPASKDCGLVHSRWGGHSRFMSEWYMAQKLCGVRGGALDRARQVFSEQVMRNQLPSGAFRFPGWEFQWRLTEQYATANWFYRIVSVYTGWGPEMTTAQAVYALGLPKGLLPVMTEWKDN